MHALALDTETALIRPALLAPPLVCVTSQRVGVEPTIAHQCDAYEYLRRAFLDAETQIVGQNVSYDMAVICERFPALRPLVFAAYDADRVTDTKIQQLLDIAGGVYRGRIGEKGRWIKHEYSLEALSKRLTGVQLAKDGWRLSYAELLDTPIASGRHAPAQCRSPRGPVSPPAASPRRDEAAHSARESDPEQCLRYPLDDARRRSPSTSNRKSTRRTSTISLVRRAPRSGSISRARGGCVRTPSASRRFVARRGRLRRDRRGASPRGLVRADGTRDTKAAKARMVSVCERERLPLRRTDAHASCSESDACVEHVCLDSDACAASGDETLAAYAEISTLKKVLSNDVETLRKGIEYPVHTRYGLAETGRTTSSGPNIQNLRRRAGIREAFVPRPSKVFAQADYPQLELYTLAQCCVSWVGKSNLADALNAGLDPHLAMAAQILGTTYEDAKANLNREDVDNARQTAKVANFGFPGGLGIEKLILFAKKAYRVELTYEQAKRLKEQWFATWPEMLHYFAPSTRSAIRRTVLLSSRRSSRGAFVGAPPTAPPATTAFKRSARTARKPRDS